MWNPARFSASPHVCTDACPLMPKESRLQQQKNSIKSLLRSHFWTIAIFRFRTPNVVRRPVRLLFRANAFFKSNDFKILRFRHGPWVIGANLALCSETNTQATGRSGLAHPIRAFGGPPTAFGRRGSYWRLSGSATNE